MTRAEQDKAHIEVINGGLRRVCSRWILTRKTPVVGPPMTRAASHSASLTWRTFATYDEQGAPVWRAIQRVRASRDAVSKPDVAGDR